jgi:uncharacterized damage-inducible protein DinB
MPQTSWRRLFAYDAWANRESWRSLGAMDAPPDHAVATLGHVVAAEWLWLGRMAHDVKKIAVWPALSLEQVADELRELDFAWDGFFEQVLPERLGSSCEYTNSKGERFTSTVQDILMHVILHGEHHRGQIARLVRHAGGEPAYTDFIHAVRTHGL